MKGTSRPTRYHILWDENHFKSNELQIWSTISATHLLGAQNQFLWFHLHIMPTLLHIEAGFILIGWTLQHLPKPHYLELDLYKWHHYQNSEIMSRRLCSIVDMPHYFFMRKHILIYMYQVCNKLFKVQNTSRINIFKCCSNIVRCLLFWSWLFFLHLCLWV